MAMEGEKKKKKRKKEKKKKENKKTKSTPKKPQYRNATVTTKMDGPTAKCRDR